MVRACCQASLAQEVMGVADGVPGSGLTNPVVEILVQAKGLLGGRECLLILAEQGVTPTDLVENPGLSGQVAGGLEQVEGLVGVVDGATVITPPFPHPRQAEVGVAAGLDPPIMPLSSRDR